MAFGRRTLKGLGAAFRGAGDVIATSAANKRASQRQGQLSDIFSSLFGGGEAATTSDLRDQLGTPNEAGTFELGASAGAEGPIDDERLFAALIASRDPSTGKADPTLETVISEIFKNRRAKQSAENIATRITAQADLQDRLARRRARERRATEMSDDPVRFAKFLVGRGLDEKALEQAGLTRADVLERVRLGEEIPFFEMQEERTGGIPFIRNLGGLPPILDPDDGEIMEGGIFGERIRRRTGQGL